MTIRKKPVFENGHFYHVFNRGVNKTKIFFNAYDYKRFCSTFGYYKNTKPRLRYSHYVKLNEQQILEYITELSGAEKNVEIHAFCLMPNHFHFALKQLRDGGISKFMSQLCNSYTRYANTKHGRTGHLFTGSFKAVHVVDELQLLQLTRYIHLNPLRALLVSKKQLEHYAFSSFATYTDTFNSKHAFVNKDFVLSFYNNNPKKYRDFVLSELTEKQNLLRDEHFKVE